MSIPNRKFVTHFTLDTPLGANQVDFLAGVAETDLGTHVSESPPNLVNGEYERSPQAATTGFIATYRFARVVG